MGSRRRSFRQGGHLDLEIVAANHRGKPLGDGEPVPGCGCRGCSGVDPDEVLAKRVHPEARRAWAEKVNYVRTVGVAEIAERLGCGEPVRKGRELHVRCPLHEDHHPSMSIDAGRNVWYCFPCAEGGDGIELWMRAKRVDFTEAVRELSG